MSYKFHLRCSLIKSFVVGMGRHCLLDKRSLGGQLVGLAIRCSNRSGKHKNFTRESEIFDQQCNGLSGCISYQVTSWSLVFHSKLWYPRVMKWNGWVTEAKWLKEWPYKLLYFSPAYQVATMGCHTFPKPPPAFCVTSFAFLRTSSTSRNQTCLWYLKIHQSFAKSIYDILNHRGSLYVT